MLLVFMNQDLIGKAVSDNLTYLHQLEPFEPLQNNCQKIHQLSYKSLMIRRSESDHGPWNPLNAFHRKILLSPVVCDICSIRNIRVYKK